MDGAVDVDDDGAVVVVDVDGVVDDDGLPDIDRFENDDPVNTALVRATVQVLETDRSKAADRSIVFHLLLCRSVGLISVVDCSVVAVVLVYVCVCQSSDTATQRNTTAIKNFISYRARYRSGLGLVSFWIDHHVNAPQFLLEKKDLDMASIFPSPVHRPKEMNERALADLFLASNDVVGHDRRQRFNLIRIRTTTYEGPDETHNCCGKRTTNLRDHLRKHQEQLTKRQSKPRQMNLLWTLPSRVLVVVAVVVVAVWSHTAGPSTGAVEAFVPGGTFQVHKPTVFGVNTQTTAKPAGIDSKLHASSTMEPIFTPKTDIPFNFGPTAPRDTTLYTAERPGNSILSDTVTSVTNEQVQEWIGFMKEQGIGHVLVLLDDNELEVYEEPGLLQLYQDGGLTPHQTPLGEDGAYGKITDILKDIDEKGEKAVTHCTGGTGRAGRVAAGWLTSSKYGLSAEEATKEAVESAIDSGVHRLGNVEKLQKWME